MEASEECPSERTKCEYPRSLLDAPIPYCCFEPQRPCDVAPAPTRERMGGNWEEAIGPASRPLNPDRRFDNTVCSGTFIVLSQHVHELSPAFTSLFKTYLEDRC